MVLKNTEMKEFLKNIRQKRNPGKADKMFGFGFNNNSKIFLTRGSSSEVDMTKFLLKNRIEEIKKFI